MFRAQQQMMKRLETERKKANQNRKPQKNQGKEIDTNTTKETPTKQKSPHSLWEKGEEAVLVFKLGGKLQAGVSRGTCEGQGISITGGCQEQRYT